MFTAISALLKRRRTRRWGGIASSSGGWRTVPEAQSLPLIEGENIPLASTTPLRRAGTRALPVRGPFLGHLC
jgi:hypothetical protein